MTWINFLHFYQPTLASSENIDEVVRSCYEPWIRFLEKNSDLKITVNFTACLTEKLFNLGYQDLLKRLAKLAERGQVEFVETLAFHSIAPLLPEKEIIKQIRINADINRNRFGSVYNPQGFFLPEMAYSDQVAKIISKLGYKYLILDETTLNSSEKINQEFKYKIKGTELNVVFRNRKLSQSFVPKKLLEIIQNNSHTDSQSFTFITATDGELYGHRYIDWWPSYTKTLNHLNTKTISEYLNNLNQEVVVKLRKSSWESTPHELKKKIPFALWKNPKNKIHQRLWKLTNFALKLNYKNEQDKNHFASRLHLENGLASCTFWWASKKDFSQVFGPHAWDPTFIEKGAQELLNSVRSLEKINPRTKLKAEKMYRQIHELVWKSHWKNEKI